MKRFFPILSAALIAFLIPCSTITGQEKKSEQKIKIVVSDVSGTKIIIDTLINDGNDIFVKHDDGANHMYVFTSTDENEKSEDMKTVTVTSTDSGTWTVKDDGSDGTNTEKVFIIKSGEGSEKVQEKTVNVWVEKDSKEITEYKTRSIIAKDGMVITIEGDDEEKVQSLTKEIQQKMGIKKQ